MTTLPETSDALKPLAMRMVLILAVVYFLLEWLPGWLGTYGYFIDELYYIACSDRLAFGYVDHPPLSILFFVTRSWTE